MIARMIQKRFSSTAYVQLSEDRIRIYHLENGSVYDQRPFIAIEGSGRRMIVHAIGDEAYKLRSDSRFDVSNPFSHPRMLVSSFSKAEKVLSHGIRAVHESRFLAPSPVAIMHPLEKLEGGLTEIECRVYRELALGAGAREVHIHVGEPLSTSRFEPDKIRPPENM